MMACMIPLPVQVDMIFQDLSDELGSLSAGTVFMHVENRKVSTYGVRHRLDSQKSAVPRASDNAVQGTVSDDLLHLFREMASDIVSRKSDWSCGTVSYKFSIQQGNLHVSADFADLDGVVQE